jgi:hypothetical protein
VICPKCGEDNSDNFRFCGMCGAVLEARRPTGATATNPPSAAAPRAANTQVPPISGPSMLGLNQYGASQPSSNHPSTDLLRDRSFSGLDSFLEPEQPKTGGRRILLMVALLAALGVAGWWTYTNYLGVAESRKPQAATSSTAVAPAENPPAKPVPQDAVPAPAAAAPTAAVPSAGVPEGPAETAKAAPRPTSKADNAEAKPEADAKPATPATIVHAEKSAPKREPSVAAAKPSKLPSPAAADTGDAAFRQGEAYLYGRGAKENCDEAVKYLKAASAKSNAKARSAFGTMYATGHCVPRDLPTSYLWFALALRVDPNNQILEKDLSAIWNQMTPPERQMATRMKQ